MFRKMLVIALTLSACCSAAFAEGSGSLIGLTKITCEKAEAIALEKFPGALVEEISLDRDDTPLVWEVKMRFEKIWKVELEIDATSGAIVHEDKHKHW
jgi:uncharacterized membrane protein YkoI